MDISAFRNTTKADYLSIRKTLRAKHLWYDFKATPTQLEERVIIKGWIEDLQENGKVAVYEWGRDCDMCEADSMRLIPANVIAYEMFERNVYKSAEGPVTCRLATMDEYAEFYPTFRDRIAEAWDNGNTAPHIV